MNSMNARLERNGAVKCVLLGTESLPIVQAVSQMLLENARIRRSPHNMEVFSAKSVRTMAEQAL